LGIVYFCVMGKKKTKISLLELYAESFDDPTHKIVARKFAVSLYRDDMGGNRGIHLNY
jgi:hypothetical protein